MSLNYRQTEDYIERLYSNFPNMNGATKAFMMCASHESKGGEFLMQRGIFDFNDKNDHGRGIVQIQQNLHDDVIDQSLRAHKILAEHGYESPHVNICYHDIKYSALIFRLHFMRFKHSFPFTYFEMGCYLKEYWNSDLGKATPEKYVEDFVKWQTY